MKLFKRKPEAIELTQDEKKENEAIRAIINSIPIGDWYYTEDKRQYGYTAQFKEKTVLIEDFTCQGLQKGYLMRIDDLKLRETGQNEMEELIEKIRALRRERLRVWKNDRINEILSNVQPIQKEA